MSAWLLRKQNMLCNVAQEHRSSFSAACQVWFRSAERRNFTFRGCSRWIGRSRLKRSAGREPGRRCGNRGCRYESAKARSRVATRGDQGGQGWTGRHERGARSDQRWSRFRHGDGEFGSGLAISLRYYEAWRNDGYGQLAASGSSILHPGRSLSRRVENRHPGHRPSSYDFTSIFSVGQSSCRRDSHSLAACWNICALHS